MPQAEIERLAELDDDEEMLQKYWISVNGAIPICHQGCALRDWLVVSGPEAGSVWHDATADYDGWSPHTLHDGRHMSFADWYLAWLDEALQTPRALAIPHLRRR